MPVGVLEGRMALRVRAWVAVAGLGETAGEEGGCWLGAALGDTVVGAGATGLGGGFVACAVAGGDWIWILWAEGAAVQAAIQMHSAATTRNARCVVIPARIVLCMRTEGNQEASAMSKNVPASPLLGDPDEPFDWDRVSPRDISPEQWIRYEGYMREIFEAMGMNLETPGTVRTPERFLRAIFESTSGYEGDPNLLTAFPTECRGGPDCRLSQVIEGPINFHALCEHHCLPFFGVAHVGYVPHESIIGISKLARLVRLFSRRFTVQERMGVEIADTLVSVLEPHGVAVHLVATHLCTQMRGVKDETSRTWTSFWRGCYEEDPAMRDEFLQTVRFGANGTAH